jgi:hypothetical protein
MTINSRAVGLINDNGWQSSSNNRKQKQKQKQRQNKRVNVTSERSKKSVNTNDIKIDFDSSKEFPDLGTFRKQSKLEKKMNYLGVVSHEVCTKKEDYVRDGWLRIKKHEDGFISKTYGKNSNSLQIEQEMENRNINQIFRNIVIRHNNYKLLDQDTYFTNYHFSWESDSDNESMSDGFSDDGDDGDEYYDEDDEFNADY